MRAFAPPALLLVAATCCVGLPARSQPVGTVGKNIVVDGKPMSTDGRIVTIDGNQVLFDGKPVVVDGKPLVTDGRTVSLDGRTVVQGGRFVTRPAMLVFTIDTRWPGGSAYRIERDVAMPIERALRSVPGVLDIHSNIVGPRTQTRLAFAPSTDPGSTETLIRQRIEQIKSRLPHDAGRPLVAWRREAAETGQAAFPRE